MYMLLPQLTWVALVQAGEEDDRAPLKAVIKACISRQRDELFAALAHAAKAGEVEEVRQLLRRGAEIDGVDYDGRSVLAMVFNKMRDILSVFVISI